MEEVEETDDEVFTDKIYSRTEQRTRHLSDCIDSVGDNFDLHRHSFSEFNDCETIRTKKSPPNTPDLGYHSPGFSSLVCRPVWFRYSTDEMDAGTVENAAAFYNSPPPQNVARNVFRESATVAKMPVEKYADEYNMNHPKRGLAIILNNDQFSSDRYPDRKGSERDVESLETCFRELDFEVVVYHNLNFSEVHKTLDTLAKQDHTDSDCFAMAVLTHGMYGNMLMAYDHAYEADTLWNKFIGNACPTLAGKPKLFFIQACRGDRLDSGIHLVSQTQTDSDSFGYKIPNYADFLITFSTTTGMFSFRNKDTGTWFIQSLCEELREYGRKEDLLAIMTRVSRRVALDYESYNLLIPSQHGQKQVPTVHSMLIRNVYFRSKLSHDETSSNN